MTQKSSVNHIMITDFNPHLPQEMTLAYRAVRSAFFHFNPHLPQEMTRPPFSYHSNWQRFQSTSPAGDDSRQSRCRCVGASISIHISRRRWLLCGGSGYIKFSLFQSTSPAGDDSESFYISHSNTHISIHISRRRWLQVPRVLWNDWRDFNPHLPQEMTQLQS